MTKLRGPICVFLILLASYAYFWHSRDWNSATRLMLTYSLVDRGRVEITGLEDHTRDRARIGKKYYTDKMPGHSFLGVPVYGAARLLGMAPHPLDRKGPEYPYWAADYWVTLGTSGIATAFCGAILTVVAAGLGCGPRRSILVGLAYGLATPAYVFATLNYGHQTTACLQLVALVAIMKSHESGYWAFLAGLSASYAGLIELQAGVVSAILGFYLLARVLVGHVSPKALLAFALGALGPIVLLIVYDVVAFGSPLDMGYFHEDLEEFRQVHADDNPLGLGRLNFGLIPELLWGEFRGLLVHAPILILALPGWVVLAWQRRWALLAVTLSASVAVLAVNLSYPKWTGGWSTGPRFLLPLIPFAMLPVAAFLSICGRWMCGLAVGLAVLGWAEMSMFQMVGGRIPDGEKHPFRVAVWRIVAGEPLPGWKYGKQFERTIGDPLFARAVSGWSPGWRWLQFAPFLAIQAVLVSLLGLFASRWTSTEPKVLEATIRPSERSEA